MQLQKSVSALQVDRNKSHTIFSILWFVSLALCWYSWNIADSDPCERMCNPCFPEPCQQFQWIPMSVKDNNFLRIFTHYCIVIPGFIPSPSSSPCVLPPWGCQWLTSYLENLLCDLTAAQGSAAALPPGFHHLCLSLSHSLAAVFISSRFFRGNHCHQCWVGCELEWGSTVHLVP